MNIYNTFNLKCLKNVVNLNGNLIQLNTMICNYMVIEQGMNDTLKTYLFMS